MNSIGRLLVLGLVSTALFGCGDELQRLAGLLQGSGTSGKSKSADADPAADLQVLPRVEGKVAAIDGAEATLLGWKMVMTPADKSSARVSGIDALGHYEFFRVSTGRDQTMTLLSPDYILSAVLSMPTNRESVVAQYFRPRRLIPDATLSGQVMSVTGLQDRDTRTGLASDMDNNGTPDGAEMLLIDTIESPIDQDIDGVPNSRDPDIDGDGVANVFDDDDNGNGIVDMFDNDANGNLVYDGGEQLSDHHFDDGWLVVSHYHTPDGDELQITFRLYGAAPWAVKVSGSERLLSGASVGSTPWDGLLKDDGTSNDGNVNDGVFAARIKLASGMRPSPREVLFVDLVYRDHVESLPHTFSTVTPQNFTARFDREAPAIVLIGNPYGEVQDFFWSADVMCDDQLVWKSQMVPGTTRQVAIERDLSDFQQCEVQLEAYAMSPMVGYPWIVNESPIVRAE